MPELEERLDNFYASALGCDPSDFHSGGVGVVSSERVGEIRFAKGTPLVLFAIARPGGAVVSVRPCLKDAAERAVEGLTWPDAAFDALERALAPLVDARFWFRGRRLYCAPETFSDRTIGEVREVTRLDETAEALHATWGGPVFGQIVGGQTVAWAAVKPLSDVAWDLSLQTRPEHRGRGFAKSVASAAVRHILEHDRLATWGTDTTNVASLRTAHAVGFQDYGLDCGCVRRMP